MPHKVEDWPVMKPISSSAVISMTTAAVLAADAASAAAGDADTLLARIKSKDDKVRCEAWQSAAAVGAPAIAPLAVLLVDADIEIARAARHAIEKLVHHAGRPNAAGEARAVETELIALLKQESPTIRRMALWMLSEIGSDQAVQPVAGLLADAQLRDDARCTLQRIPGEKSIKALNDALAAAPEEFKFAIAESLRKRDQTVAGYPSKKLVPTLSTQVKAQPATTK